MCPEKSDLVSIRATNGISYSVCLSYIVTGNMLGQYGKSYLYPDRIDLPDGSGYLLRDKLSLLARYEFYPKVVYNGSGGKNGDSKNGNGSNGDDFIRRKKELEKKYDEKNGNGQDQIIEGIDNKVLIIAGIALLFILK